MSNSGRVRSEKNIWVAAGDGDLDRVRELVEHQSVSPNMPDPYTYTPMHAAASYGHLDVLDYLISHGGDVNITDDEGDTPLYTVENIATAKYLVEHGAIVNRRNIEGVSPIEHLAEDFPEVSNFLQSLSSSTTTAVSGQAIQQSQQQPSQHSQNIASENLTSELMQSVQDILQRAEAEGRDPEEELRQAVSRTVAHGLVAGYELSEGADTSDRRPSDAVGNSPGFDGAKRTKTDGPS